MGNKIFKDHSIGGFVCATLASIIIYFFTKWRTPLEAYLLSYLFSVCSYLTFVALMKDSDYEKNWDGMEIFTAFFMSGIAQWGNAILCFIFGFPAGENILKSLT